MVSLGDCYRNGSGVEKNQLTAYDWYRKAAEMEHSEAIGSVAEMLMDGIGMPEDKPEGFKWYMRGAELGDSYCQNSVGCVVIGGEKIANQHTHTQVGV
jgi:TPR repeat protein